MTLKVVFVGNPILGIQVLPNYNHKKGNGYANHCDGLLQDSI